MKKTKFINILASAFVAVMVFSCSTQQSTEPVESNDIQQTEYYTYVIGDVIPNDYIVQFNVNNKLSNQILSVATYEESTQLTNSYANEVFAMNNIKDFKIQRTYSRSITGVNVILNDIEVALLRNNPNVKHIEPNRIISLGKGGKGKGGGETTTPPDQTIPWGAGRTGTGDGSGKTCWIIDTGIDLDHPDLNVSTSLSKSFLTGKQSTNPDDQNGHGTHVAGTVAAKNNSIGSIGVAYGATVVSVRVLDRRGSGNFAGVIAGVDYVAAKASSGDVANLSLGGSTSSTSLDDAVIAAANLGIRFTIAAGNSAKDASGYTPARVNGTNIYTVSAMTTNDNWAYFSNYGNPPIDYCEPGVSIFSTWKGASYKTISGTSMASPHLAGILLLGAITTDGYVKNDPDGNADPIGVK